MATATIVGAGFAGMTVALCLQSRGIKPTIFEARDESYTSGGNIALAPNALRVLDHVGVFERIRTKGFNYEELSFANGNGTTLGVFLNGSQEKYSYQAIRIHRTIVRDALRELCRERGITINYGRKCSSVEETGSDETRPRVMARFGDGDTVESDFVVGADGIHSYIRKHVAPDCEAPSFSGLMGVMGTMTSEGLSDVTHKFQLPAMLFGSSGSFAIMPSSYNGNEVGYFATIEADDRSREEWDALGKDKKALHDMLESRFCTKSGTWPSYVQALSERTPADTLTSWPFFSVPTMSSWCSPSARVILIGDAAHAIPPTGGQGAAMALEDAETLALAIAQALLPSPHAGNSVQPRLQPTIQRWDAQRHDRVERVLAFTTKQGSLRKSSPHFYEQAAKEWLMWAMFKWSGPEAGMRWLYEYDAMSMRAVLG